LKLHVRLFQDNRFRSFVRSTETLHSDDVTLSSSGSRRVARLRQFGLSLFLMGLFPIL
jgi:hypothetical protein